MSSRGRPNFRANNQQPRSHTENVKNSNGVQRTEKRDNENKGINMKGNNSQREEIIITNSKEIAQEKFEQQKRQNTEAILRALENACPEQNNILDEEEEIIISNVKKRNNYDNPALNEKLLSSLENPCLICLDRVRVKDSIWQCETCYCLIHLNCAQQWARSSITDIDAEVQRWYCPQCRCDYPKTQIPRDYYCFCKKEINPVPDAWIAPHSCGQICGKYLKPHCGHTCPTQCHPGRCSPCAQTVTAVCFCGKKKTVRRCNEQGYSCNSPCNKLLQCNKHRCEEDCHEGECKPCTKTSEQRCLCGDVTKLVECTKASFRCDKVCKQLLPCGKHSCQNGCHKAGDCTKECELMGPRNCFCGKSTFDFIPCDLPTSSCGDSCDKLLACGIHRCMARCHSGDCPSCKFRTEKYCKCKSTKRNVLCDSEFTCDKRCTKMKNCRRHQCKKKCCLGACPPCEEICNKKLTCRNHKCEALCHSGPCFPCNKTVTIYCSCKQTSITVPCGSEQNYKEPPTCQFNCIVPPTCHHPSREPHQCHVGDCPPCKQICAVDQPSCYHTCRLKCHDPKPIIQYTARKRKPIRPKPLLVSEVVCPPCPIKVNRQCFGLHEVKSLACSSNRLFPCPLQCGNPLKCGNHYCNLPCHVVTHPRPLANGDVRILVIDEEETLPRAGTFEEKEIVIPTADGPIKLKGMRNIREIMEYFGKVDTCEECPLPCQKKRIPSCKHPCPLPCHPGECPKCTVPISKYCHCPLNIKKVYFCHETHISNEQMEKELSCGSECTKKLPCSHICGEICHAGPCRSSLLCTKSTRIFCKCKRIKKSFPCNESKEAKVECDEECQKRIEQSKKVEEVVTVKEEIEANSEQPKKRRRKQSNNDTVTVKKKKKPYFFMTYPFWKKVFVYSLPLLLILMIVFLSMMQNNPRNKRF